MTATDKHERRFPTLAVVLCVVVLVVVVYVLSFGALEGLNARGYIKGDNPIWIIYLPITWVYRHSDLAQHIIDKYLSLWGVTQ
jgi:hypothetical protein